MREKTELHGNRRKDRILWISGILLLAFLLMAAYSLMCLYLFAVCDLAYINFQDGA